MRMSLSTAAVPVALAGILHATSWPNQQRQSAIECPATEQRLLDVEHELWSAARSRDVAALDRIVDDRFLSTDDAGLRTGKKELVAKFKQPEGNIHNDTDEQPSDIRLVVVNGVAILSFTKHWTDYDKNAGISFGATSVMTRVLACTNGEWKVVAFHETGVPNKNRQPLQVSHDHRDDYVGHYRFGDTGDKGDISIVRTGDKLVETWRGEEPVEILAGKYDTFFAREDGLVERFVRDKSGTVTGILYTYPDAEIEAKRVP